MPHVHTEYPSGMVPGAWPSLFPPDPDGRNNSAARHPRHYVRSTDCLGSADRQVAPSGVIDPLRWLLARYLPKIPPKIPATGMVEAA